MKTLKISSFILLFLLAFSACEDELDLAPITTTGENGFFTNADEIDAGIIGVYDALQEAVMREFVLCEVRSDNTTTIMHEGDYDAVDMFTDDATTGIVDVYWIAQYNVIARANKVLKYINNVADEDTKAEMDAELRFLRAYCHFNLVRLFGAVPKIDKEISYTDTDMFKNASVTELYTFIETELTTAVSNLPATRSGDEVGRATSLAAKALLAQVYYAQGKDTQALPLFNDVVGTYAFSEAYDQVFAIGNEMNDEIVFAVRFATGVGEGQDIGDEFTINGEFSGLNNPTPALLALYEEGDLRKAFSVSDNATPVLTKYAEDNTTDSEMDWIVIRKAEALLSRAAINAEADGGISQSAIDDINMLRTRAGLAAYTVGDFASKQDLLDAIEKERRIELLGENYRWFDLLREGNALSVMEDHLGKSISSGYELFAIPQREIDASQGVLTQNR